MLNVHSHLTISLNQQINLMTADITPNLPPSCNYIYIYIYMPLCIEYEKHNNEKPFEYLTTYNKINQELFTEIIKRSQRT